MTSTDKDFIGDAGEAFEFGLTDAIAARSDTFSFEFDAPAGRMTMICLVRPKEVADSMMEAMLNARQVLIEAGQTYAPMTDPNLGKDTANAMEGGVSN